MGRGASPGLLLDDSERFSLDTGLGWEAEAQLTRLAGFVDRIKETAEAGEAIGDISRGFFDLPEWRLLRLYSQEPLAQSILDQLTSDKMLAFWNPHLWRVNEFGGVEREASSCGLVSDYTPFAVRVERKVHLKDAIDETTSLCGVSLPARVRYLSRSEYSKFDCCKACWSAESSRIPLTELLEATRPVERWFSSEKEASLREVRARAKERLRDEAREMLLKATYSVSYGEAIAARTVSVMEQECLDELAQIPSEIRFANLFHHSATIRTASGAIRSHLKALESLGKAIREAHPEAPREASWPSAAEMAGDLDTPREAHRQQQLWFAARVSARIWPETVKAFIEAKPQSRRTLGEKFVAAAVASLGE